MNTDKLEIQRLVSICEAYGISHAVICPGSRNAPLTVAFNRSNIDCTIIPDERVAGFFALGIALQTKLPTVLICTSGSAALNFAPAIVEAFYQGVPLLVLTADRPSRLIDQGHGQTIRQSNVYANYVKESYDFPEADQIESYDFIDQMVVHSIEASLEAPFGPVHINVPLEEPLYDLTDQLVAPFDDTLEISKELFEFDDYAERVSAFSKVMLIVAQNIDPSWSVTIQESLKDKNIVILSEVTSNIESDFPCIDRVLTSLSTQEEATFAPDLLMSIGGAVVSKKIKAFLTKNPPKEHWNIGPQVGMCDPYDALTEVLECSEWSFLEHLESAQVESASYFDLWKNRDQQLINATDHYLATTPWCDYKAFEILFKHIPVGTDVHFGNSTVVRYANLFPLGTKYQNYCNRGTSGIDGVTSTAMGSAYASTETTTVITGDIAFLYDSNALWHPYLKDLDLKIILINNGGGGIFRIIPGPDQLEELEAYFDCYTPVDIQKIVEAYGLTYRVCSDEKNLSDSLKALYAQKGVAFLEIKTDGAESAKVLRDYFKMLKAH